jgi:hypothetical protein
LKGPIDHIKLYFIILEKKHVNTILVWYKIQDMGLNLLGYQTTRLKGVNMSDYEIIFKFFILVPNQIDTAYQS